MEMRWRRKENENLCLLPPPLRLYSPTSMSLSLGPSSEVGTLRESSCVRLHLFTKTASAKWSIFNDAVGQQCCFSGSFWCVFFSCFTTTLFRVNAYDLTNTFTSDFYHLNSPFWRLSSFCPNDVMNWAIKVTKVLFSNHSIRFKVKSKMLTGIFFWDIVHAHFGSNKPLSTNPLTNHS